MDFDEDQEVESEVEATPSPRQVKRTAWLHSQVSQFADKYSLTFDEALAQISQIEQS